jgi:hypothetical protein
VISVKITTNKVFYIVTAHFNSYNKSSLEMLNLHLKFIKHVVKAADSYSQLVPNLFKSFMKMEHSYLFF